MQTRGGGPQTPLDRVTGHQWARTPEWQKLLIKVLNWFTTFTNFGEEKKKKSTKWDINISRCMKMWAYTPGCEEGPRFGALGWTWTACCRAAHWQIWRPRGFVWNEKKVDLISHTCQVCLLSERRTAIKTHLTVMVLVLHAENGGHVAGFLIHCNKKWPEENLYFLLVGRVRSWIV